MLPHRWTTTCSPPSSLPPPTPSPPVELLSSLEICRLCFCCSVHTHLTPRTISEGKFHSSTIPSLPSSSPLPSPLLFPFSFFLLFLFFILYMKLTLVQHQRCHEDSDATLAREDHSCGTAGGGKGEGEGEGEGQR